MIKESTQQQIANDIKQERMKSPKDSTVNFILQFAKAYCQIGRMQFIIN